MENFTVLGAGKTTRDKKKGKRDREGREIIQWRKDRGR